jgi:hypothetical protein
MWKLRAAFGSKSAPSYTFYPPKLLESIELQWILAYSGNPNLLYIGAISLAEGIASLRGKALVYLFWKQIY